MRRRFAVLVPSVALTIAIASSLCGCKNGNNMSDKDIADIKKGPPKEMPEEARKIMQQSATQRAAATNAPQVQPPSN